MGIRSYGRRVLRARPGDHLLALTSAVSSVPVVGRHLEAVGGLAALGVGGRHYLPGILGDIAQPRLSRRVAEQRRLQRAGTPDVLTESLRDLVADEEMAVPWPSHTGLAPILKAAGQRRYVQATSVRYGSDPRQVLDVWRRDDRAERPAPVMIFLPGGAWVFGRRELQGHTLMAHMARCGWICLSVQYRTSPQYRWPRQMIDVTTAIAWARANVHRYGGDPGFVAVVGCSAGGHLASLAGLNTGVREWNTRLSADVSPSVDAVVSVYGLYDWQDRSTGERDRFVRYLERIVVKRSQSRHPEVFAKASPIARIHADAPPFLVVHGSNDVIIPVAEARLFAERLRAVSRAKTGYIELPGLGHGFDLIDTRYTVPVVSAIGRFLDQVHRDHVDITRHSAG